MFDRTSKYYNRLRQFLFRLISERTFGLVCLLLATTIGAYAQSPHVPGTVDNDIPANSKTEQKINFGIKGGFTSSLFLVSNLSINGAKVDEVQNNYKIGHFSSIFMRINFRKYFLQPEISYNVNRCNITFYEPGQTSETTANPPSITSSIHSIDVPVLYGYNVVKSGIYSMAIFGGPKLRYIWNKKSEITFENFNIDNLHEKLYPFNVSLTIGTAVTISRIFFDFRYDIGLHNISRKITEHNTALTDDTAPQNELRFQRRDNVLSFSLGLIF